MLPFYEERNLPQMKAEFSLNAIVNVVVHADVLIIEFVPEINIKPWEFVCEQDQVANKWRDVIKEAVRVYKINDGN